MSAAVWAAVLAIITPPDCSAQTAMNPAAPGRPAPGWYAPGWYASDAAGMAFDAISGPEASDYALFVSTDEATTRSELYRGGASTKAWVRTTGPGGTLAREAYEEGGLMREETLYDASGRPSLERIFMEGGQVSETSYQYAAGRLTRKTTAQEGAALSSIVYLYAPDGRLAAARETSGSDSTPRDFGTSAAASGGASSWRMGPEGMELRSYDGSGRLVSVATYAGTDIVSLERRAWLDGNLASIELSTGDGRRVTTTYVAEGAARGEAYRISIERDGKPVSTEERAYDESGRLLRVDTETANARISVVYAYDEAGVLAEETRSANGATTTVIRYLPDSVRIELLYDGGAPFARVRYEDGRRVLEEILKNGEVVRSRRFD